MVAPTSAPRLRAARTALFAVFGLNGLVSALWFVHIPAVTERTGVSHSTLGMLILLMSGSAIGSMQAAGTLTDRFGSRAVTAVAAALTAVAIIGPAFATGPITLAAALIGYGIGFGALDVAMNAHAVEVESGYCRPIMSSFHALFSGGSLAGALVGAAAQRVGSDIRLTMIVTAILGLAVVAFAAPRLLPRIGSTRERTASATAAADSAASGRPDDRLASHRDHAFASPCPPQTATTREPTSSREGHDTETRGSHAIIAPGPRPPLPSAATTSPDLNTATTREYSTPAPDGDGATAAEPRTAASLDPRADTPHSASGPVPSEAEARAELSFAQHETSVPVAASTVRKVVALAAVAFAMLMAEGVVGDWSALQMSERLGVEAGTAALAFAAFSVAMTVGRLCADRVSGRFGPVAVVRWGSLLAAAGYLLVVVSPWTVLTVLGWALCGIGLSGGVPQVFTAAGNLGSRTAATDMSRVFGIGYLGLLAGPVIIGWLTELVPLTTAMLFPLAAMLVCAWFARIVAPPVDRQPAPLRPVAETE
ncbi:MFS transporter [Nocardia otitidiscaviarum]|uniref:MFS transporter n=1 Tax=Nocardia otitidiscaviarum TaxID=1823 RepID=UPI001E366D2F|nr:MFS transporter [Nocardia otitidiscaviarum]